jgi:membrane protein
MTASGARPGTVQARIEAAVGAVYRRLSENRVTRLPWAVVQTFSKAHGALLAGSMAYYTFLSLLPLVMVASFIAGVVSTSSLDARRTLANAVDQIFPGTGTELLDQLIDAKVALGIFGVITIVYAGSGFAGAMTACLNRMWNVPSGRNPVGQKLLNLVVVILLGLVLLGSTVVTVWVGYLAEQAFGERAAPTLIRTVELIASPLSILVVLLLLYRLLPARRLSWRGQVPGAIFGALGFELLKRGFAFWASNSAGISTLPRSLLSVVLLLVWLGLFGQLILYGAALNVVLDRRRKGEPLIPADVPAIV